MHFQQLADVHTRRHAQRVEHDVHRHAVGHVRHVLDRHDLRNHALVTVTAGHLVARLHAALHRQVHLDHLQHARAQLVAGLDLALLVLELLVELGTLFLELAGGAFQLVLRVFVVQTDLEPLVALEAVEVGGGDFLALLQLARTAVGGLAQQQLAQTVVDVVLEDTQLVAEVLAHFSQLGLLDRQRALVLLDALTGEHAHVDDGAVHAGRHLEAGVLHVGGLLAEDGAQQLLLRGELGLALRRDLAHQDVAGLDLGADVDDAGLVELAQRGLVDVGDVAGDFLRSQLGFTGDAGQLFDMDSGGNVVFLDHPLRQQDRSPRSCSRSRA